MTPVPEDCGSKGLWILSRRQITTTHLKVKEAPGGWLESASIRPICLGLGPWMTHPGGTRGQARIICSQGDELGNRVSLARLLLLGVPRKEEGRSQDGER